MSGHDVHRATLRLPDGQPNGFRPEDWLRFIHFQTFTREWERLGLNDDDLRALEICIMAMPDAGDVIEGAGGLRKLRFSPARWKAGKSGALRVLYAHLKDHGIVLLMLVFKKNKQENLTKDEKLACKAAIERAKNVLNADPGE